MGFNFEKKEKEPPKEPEKVTLTALKKQRDDLLLAKESGYLIPPLLIDMVEENIRIKQNVHSLWKCANKKCTQTYESHVPVKAVGCQCGSYYRRVWTNPQWQRA